MPILSLQKTHNLMTESQKKKANNERMKDETGLLNPPAGFTREQWTGNTSGNIIDGIYICLHLASEPVDTEFISLRTLFRRRTINQTLDALMNHSCARDVFIKTSPGRSQTVYYELNPLYRNMVPKTVRKQITGTLNRNHIYASSIANNGPNKEEAAFESSLKKVSINPYDWKFTGDICYENRIKVERINIKDGKKKDGLRYADFSDKKRGLVVEYLGPYHEWFNRQNKKDYDSDEEYVRKRTLQYRKVGIEPFFVWHTEFKKDPDEVERNLKEFIIKHKDRKMPSKEELKNQIRIVNRANTNEEDLDTLLETMV